MINDGETENIMGNKTEVYVATHKKTDTVFPTYCHKIQVGAKGKEAWDGYLRDDTGDNISEKNYCYCELTALYSMWKNSDADIKGLYHYRRFLGRKERYTLMDKAMTYMGITDEAVERYIIKEEEIEESLKHYDLILPFKDCPYLLTAFEDLERFVYLKDINVMINVIEELYPEYARDLWATLQSVHISYCNMFIAPAEISDDYCSWLFGVLGEVEKRIDISDYDTGHKRIYGYLSEVLLNVYVRHKGLKAKKVDYLILYERGTVGKIVAQAKRIVNAPLACLGIYPTIRGRVSNKAKYYEHLRYMEDPSRDMPPFKTVEEMLDKAGAGKIYEKDGYTIGYVFFKDDDICVVSGEITDISKAGEASTELKTFCERLKEEDLEIIKDFLYPRLIYTGSEDVDMEVKKSLMRDGVVLMETEG